MKHLLFGLVVAAAVAVHAEDSYLYWMVGDTSYEYDSANLIASTSGSWSWTERANFVGSASSADIAAAKGFGDGIYSSIASYSGDSYTYFIELIEGSKVVAYSTTGLAYKDVSSYLSSLTQFDPGASSLWTASSFATAPIPEPTSGIMLLLGVAVLALRRRRT